MASFVPLYLACRRAEAADHPINWPTAAEFAPTVQFRIATKNPITGKMPSTTRMPSTMAPWYSAGMWPKSSVT